MKNRVSRHLFWGSVLLPLYFIFTLSPQLGAQTRENQVDAQFIDKIYDQSLTNGRCYPWLEHLSLKIGHRLSGSPSAAKAVTWTKSMLDTLGLDSVWLQPCMVPHWVRGEASQVKVLGSKKQGSFPLASLALGSSIGGKLEERANSKTLCG